MKDMGWDKFSLLYGFVPKKKKLEVVALTIVIQSGVNFKIMLLVVQYQDHWLRSNFEKENPFFANEASFIHSEGQIKCYLKHEHTKCSCVVEWLRALQKGIHKCEFESWPNHLFI